jgi:hypothetical protein
METECLLWGKNWVLVLQSKKEGTQIKNNL